MFMLRWVRGDQIDVQYSRIVYSDFLETSVNLWIYIHVRLCIVFEYCYHADENVLYTRNGDAKKVPKSARRKCDKLSAAVPTALTEWRTFTPPPWRLTHGDDLGEYKGKRRGDLPVFAAAHLKLVDTIINCLAPTAEPISCNILPLVSKTLTLCLRLVNEGMNATHQLLSCPSITSEFGRRSFSYSGPHLYIIMMINFIHQAVDKYNKTNTGK